MRQLIAALLACLLLCGCAQAPVAEETTAPTETTVPVQTTAPTGLYVPDSPLEERYHGAVHTYPLNLTDAMGLRTLGENLLLFSGGETTTLTLLSGEELSPAASISLDFFLAADDPSLVIGGRLFSYYDPVARETVVRDDCLNPVSHIAAPEDLQGIPVLSEDRNTLYYCTRSALRAWDLESGIRRTLKEMDYPGQSVAGLHWGSTVVHCITEERHLFLSTNDGHLITEREGSLSLVSTDSTYCAVFQLGMNPVLVYRCAGVHQILLPENFSGPYFILQNGLSAVQVTPQADTEIQLSYYDLVSGLRTSVLTLPGTQLPDAIVRSGDYVYLLRQDTDYHCSAIYRWDTTALATNDSTVCSSDYRMAGDPPGEAYTLCRQFKEALESTYGIEILIGEDAAAAEPWDYRLEPETQPALLLQALLQLESQLKDYPIKILKDTAANFTALKLCLVRSITGSAESGSLDAATGVQFLQGSDAYVVITVGQYGKQALYHELFHVMETHILNNSIAFDQWNTLNPSGFDYDYGYSANASRDAGIYLLPEHRAFIDSYSMSFPKEDRARIMEYAMIDGNRELFESSILQAKLKKLCEGIREAYGLEKTEETFLWEQYLK